MNNSRHMWKLSCSYSRLCTYTCTNSLRHWQSLVHCLATLQHGNELSCRYIPLIGAQYDLGCVNQQNHCHLSGTIIFWLCKDSPLQQNCCAIIESINASKSEIKCISLCFQLRHDRLPNHNIHDMFTPLTNSLCEYQLTTASPCRAWGLLQPMLLDIVG